MALDPTKLVNLRRAGDKQTAQCPECARQGNDATSKNHLAVYSDGRFGCCIDSSDTHRSAIWQLAGLGTDGEYVPELPPEPKLEMERTWEPDVLDRLIKDHSYWVNRGIREDVMVRLGGGVATEGQLKNRHVLPVFNEAGKIHGFTGRTLGNATPRYKHLGKVSAWVWGDLEGIEETRRAILVEGVGCRLALDSHDVQGALVLWGLNLSQAVMGYLIAANPTDIVVATNNEETGRGLAAAKRIKQTLDRFFDDGIARIELPPVKDFADIPDGAGWDEWRARLDPPIAEAAITLGPDDTA